MAPESEAPSAKQQRRPRTQAERSALSDERLIDAAIRLIVDRGTEKTTLKALGEAAGYSRGLVTYRFGSKSGLFKAVIAGVSERWLGQLAEAMRDYTGLKALLATADAYFGYVRRSPDDIRAMQILLHLAVEPASDLRSIASKVSAKQREQLEVWIRQGQDSGEIRPDVEPGVVAQQYVAYVYGMTQSWNVDRSAVNWSKAHAYFLDALKILLSARSAD